jgi:hypothetical protein
MIPHDFGMDIATYQKYGKKIETPRIYECINCGGKGLLHRHGFYLKYAITEDNSIQILICRLKCRHCRNAFSVIPDFLIPRFQHTLTTIITRLKEFIEFKKTTGSRQLLAFYLRRFMNNINWIHSFFVELGERSGIPEDKKERATKYLKMIRDFGESTFLRRSKGHLSSYFMAN